MTLSVCATLFTALLALSGGQGVDIERFPPPDFEGGHELPHTATPAPRGGAWEFVDAGLLAVTLGLASFFALGHRRRGPIFALMIFSLLYFGFWREGCVCPIGAIQNVALALADQGYAIPAAVVIFFLLPLVFTLFFGRAFCAAVCPLGAIQDLVLVHPVTLPAWLQHGLGLLAYVYLGAAILFAATGSAFIICEYDPFVAFFRFAGTVDMVILGTSFLVIGLFVGRPYCRFVCPYGALLRLIARFSWKSVRVTPADCVQCRLCEEACAFGAIEPALANRPPPSMKRHKTRLAILLVLTVVNTGAGGWLLASLAEPLSRMHATVRLGERIAFEDAERATFEDAERATFEDAERATFEDAERAAFEDAERAAFEDARPAVGTTDASEAFRGTGRPTAALHADAAAIVDDYRRVGAFVGAFLGLLFTFKLISLTIFRRRQEYRADRSLCVSCGRCFAHCPLEQERRKGRAPVPIGIEG